MELNNSTLHHVIVDTLLTRGWAPSARELAERFGVEHARLSRALRELADYHGVVLHPDSHEIWVVHPFSAAPTNFLVRSGALEWWGNCAWCSLGVVALAEVIVIYYVIYTCTLLEADGAPLRWRTCTRLHLRQDIGVFS